MLTFSNYPFAHLSHISLTSIITQPRALTFPPVSFVPLFLVFVLFIQFQLFLLSIIDDLTILPPPPTLQYPSVSSLAALLSHFSYCFFSLSNFLPAVSHTYRPISSFPLYFPVFFPLLSLILCFPCLTSPTSVSSPPTLHFHHDTSSSLR